MFEALLPHYERELGYLRELSGEFARRFPRIAGRLQLDGDQCEDPHVERLIEAFAFLTARIHRKIDDEFPEITGDFLDALYPHLLQPIPAASIVQFEADPDRPELSRGHVVEPHQTVLTPAVDQIVCRFRTCYPVQLYPLSLVAAGIELTSAQPRLAAIAPRAAAVLTLTLETHGALPLASIGLQSLRFFLDGEPALMHLLYQLLLADDLEVRAGGGGVEAGRLSMLAPGAVRPVGFAREDGLLDYDDRSFLGYRLLSEYFSFPEKFLFLDFEGLGKVSADIVGGRLVIQCLFRHFPANGRHLRLLEQLDARHLRLGCTPVVNLFRQAAEPIRLTHRRTAYPVMADARAPQAYEVVRIGRVQCIERGSDTTVVRDVLPLYAVDGDGRGESTSSLRWRAGRERATRAGDRGTDVELHLVEGSYSPSRPAAETLSVELLCSNRDLPERLPFGGSESGSHTDFSLPGQAMVRRVRLLRKPTLSVRPPDRAGWQWQLVSHLSLNHLSIADGDGAALRALLALYNPTDRQAVRRQIDGIRAVRSAPSVARLAGPDFASWVRGTDIELTLDEECYVGGSTYLFAGVLERFFALYCAPNSFVRLRYRTLQNEETVVEWAPRSGEAVVI